MVLIGYSLDKGGEGEEKKDELVGHGELEEREDDIRQEMRRLSETSESRRLQVFQTNQQLKKAQQTLNELRKAIKFKVSTSIVSSLTELAARAILV